MASKVGKSSFAVVFVLIVLLSGFGGYTLGRQSLKGGGIKIDNTNKDINMSPLFTTQTATIRGKITKVEGNKLTVSNTNNVSGTVEVSNKVLVSKLTLNPKTSKTQSSSNLKDIELNADAYLTLELSGDKYVAILIQFLPPQPNLPTLNSTKSGTPSKTVQ